MTILIPVKPKLVYKPLSTRALCYGAQYGFWILQTVSVEFLPQATRGRTLSAHRDLFNLNSGIVGALSQRRHIGANDITNPADFGVAVDFVDASLFLVKTLL
jgi:hypothetical protein